MSKRPDKRPPHPGDNVPNFPRAGTTCTAHTDGRTCGEQALPKRWSCQHHADLIEQRGAVKRRNERARSARRERERREG